MKALYGLVLVLMIFVSACAQQEPAALPAPASNPESVQETAPEPETDGTGAAVAPQMEEEQAPETKSNEVRLLGAGKYDPLEVRISKGGTITFFNEGKLKTVISIKGNGKVVNTPVIQAGDKYEQEFAETGTYEYWGVSYGPGGAKIIVE
ncbi:MAG: hypothetical protein AABX63_02995 [Nanoarchaeota archaeon]